ncbi:MAG: bifunctional 3-oxoadipate enol-lactonase/4-carboxymuconolactone decarboxylase PcaDC [Acidimicrobiia bacterium]
MVPEHSVIGPPDGPLLVLLGSLGTTGAMWGPQLPALSAHFRVVCPEHRGHGGTAAPPGRYTMADLGVDVLDLLDHLGADRASLCGISLGGVVSMWVAVHHADRVDRLVLSSTAPYFGGPAAWDERAAAVRTAGPGALLGTLLGRWFTPAFLEAEPQVADEVAAMLASCAADGYAGCCAALGDVDLRGELGRVTAPTLVVVGDRDPVTPPATALALAEGIEGAGLVVIPHAAHLVSVERPTAFGAAVLDHLAGTAAERGARVRRQVLGDAYVDASAPAASGLVASFVDLVSRSAWGEVWARPGLDRAMRSLATVAMLIALGRLDELELHVQGARRNGVTEDQIGELVLQAAVYCGAPAARAALGPVQRGLDAFREPGAGPGPAD